MYHDQEIDALNNVYEAIKGLNNPQIKRIVNWISSKFGLKNPGIVKTKQMETVRWQQPQPLEAGGKAEPGEPGKENLSSQAVNNQPISINPAVPIVNLKENSSFMNYDTFKDLVSSSNAKTIAAKILLASAYLYERRNIKEFATYDINALLKKIGQRVNNISASINSLMMKKRPLLVQTGKLGATSRSRRTYSVTEEGLRIARSYLKENSSN